MKFVIKKMEEGFPFFIKAVDKAQRALSVEVDPKEAKQFGSEQEATEYMKANGLRTVQGFSVAPLEEDSKASIVIPDGLHPDSVDLIIEFAETLASKMKDNQEKYGYGNEWKTQDWEDDCRKDMIEHIEKGDPRDVGIYCAIMNHRRWLTTIKPIKVDHTNDTANNEA